MQFNIFLVKNTTFWANCSKRHIRKLWSMGFLMQLLGFLKCLVVANEDKFKRKIPINNCSINFANKTNYDIHFSFLRDFIVGFLEGL
jgi:hypothetical protein